MFSDGSSCVQAINNKDLDIQLGLKAFELGKNYFVPRCCVQGPDSLAKAHPVEICDADAESSGKLFSPLQQSLFSDRVNISRFVTSEHR